MVSIGSIKSKPDDIHSLISHPFEENALRFRDLLRKHGADAENDDKHTPLQYAMYNMDGEDTLKYIRYENYYVSNDLKISFQNLLGRGL